MVKFIPNHDFRGLKENKLFRAGNEVELTATRAKEIEKGIQAQVGYEDFKLTAIAEEPKRKPVKRTPKKAGE